MLEKYRSQVALLIRIIPMIYKFDEFAIHGGTAINLFVSNLPRYSVDIDLTYLPINSREESLDDIRQKLLALKHDIEKGVPGVNITYKPEVLKLFCSLHKAIVKIEVNGIKRGIIGMVEERELCNEAKSEFSLTCWARLVPFTVLYGGKIVAALSRQHPRDLFDVKQMQINSFDEVKNGFIFNLLSSEKPIIEILHPHKLNQLNALTNQFMGMTNEKFDYADYEKSREDLIRLVNLNLNQVDRDFLTSFESGEPEWSKCCAGDLKHFPAISWKLHNIKLLKHNNPSKFKNALIMLKDHFAGSDAFATNI